MKTKVNKALTRKNTETYRKAQAKLGVDVCLILGYERDPEGDVHCYMDGCPNTIGRLIADVFERFPDIAFATLMSGKPVFETPAKKKKSKKK